MTPAEIRTQLQRILVSQKFVSSPQLGSFLNYVVEETLAGRTDTIKQYTVAVKALGYRTDFDPQANSIVRMQARRLRRALHHYYLHEGESDPIRIMIPVGTYVPDFAPREPGGRATQVEADSAVSTTPMAQSVHRLSASACEPVERRRPSIAVLPFLELNDAESDLHLASGLTEEIVIVLTRFGDLRVIGTLPREAMPQDGAGLQQIGNQYNSRFVLDGSIYWNEDHLHVRAKLLDTQTGDYLWVQKYTRSRLGESLADLIEQIGAEVGMALGSAYSPIWRRVTEETRQRSNQDVSALEVSLRSYIYLDNMSPAGCRRIVETLERAVALEPNSAPALAYLGNLYVDAYTLFYRDEIPPQASDYLHQALHLEPLNARVQFYFAYAAYYLGDMNGFRQAASRSLHLNPYATSTGALGLLFIQAGEEDYGMSLVEQVMQQHPQYPSHFHYAPMLIHARQGDYAAAFQEARKVRLATTWNWLLHAALLGHINQLAEAQYAWNELLAMRPDFAERPAELMRRVCGERDVSWLWNGLVKAGLLVGQPS